MIATAKYNFSAYDYASTPELEDVSFLNSNHFLHSRQWNENLHHLFLVDKNQMPQVKCTFTIVDHVAMSPYRATYGSIEMRSETSARAVEEFLIGSIRYLRERGCKSIEVIQPPACYNEEQHDLAVESLKSTGFELWNRDVDQYLTTTNKSFENIITPGELGKLRKCMRRGFECKKEGVESLNASYNLIEQSLQRKGHEVSMTFHQLREMFEKHPGHYFVFNVLDDVKLVATGITILLSPGIMYNFYHAHHTDYVADSPTVMLVKQVYDFGRAQGFDCLDLGISSENGEINQGLFRFKKALGAEPCERLSWKMQLC